MNFISLLFLLATSLTPDDERSLSEAIQRGDQSAFRTFFVRYHEPLIRYLLNRNCSRQEAEDLIQQAFIYIWEHRSNIDPDKSLRAYLYRIAYTRMLNLFRDSKSTTDTNAAKHQSNFVNLHLPDDDAAHSELLQQLHTVISELPEKRQQAFRLCFLEQLSYKEAAEVMDLSVKTIENHMVQAFKDIRTRLSSFL